MRCSSTQCLATPSKSSFGGSGMQCNPVVLEVVDKCLYLPRQIWWGRRTNVITSPANFGGGGSDKCLYLPRQNFGTDLKSDF